MRAVLAFLFLVFLGCRSGEKVAAQGSQSALATDGSGDGDGADDGDDAGDDIDDSEDDQDDDPDDETISGIIRGNVTVQTMLVEDDGTEEDISWAEAGITEFPYGAIIVTAVAVGEDGSATLVGTATIEEPSLDGDDYQIRVELGRKSRDVRVYATLDYYQDRVMGTNDPVGLYVDSLVIRDGTEAEDVDMTIRTQIYGGGGDCEVVTVSGELGINEEVSSGDAAVMLMEADGSGPYWGRSIWMSPIADDEGASADYAINLCMGVGELQLVGAWDTNNNGWIDASDSWGAYAVEPSVDGNPIIVGTEDLTEMTVEIPLGDGPSTLAILPFIRMTGSLLFDSGSIEGDIYLMALKSPPSGDAPAVSLMQQAYDTSVWEAEDLVGVSNLSYRLDLPANATVYLRLYVDVDRDGWVGEFGEPMLMQGEDADGGTTLGTADISDLNFDF